MGVWGKNVGFQGENEKKSNLGTKKYFTISVYLLEAIFVHIVILLQFLFILGLFFSVLFLAIYTNGFHIKSIHSIIFGPLNI